MKIQFLFVVSIVALFGFSSCEAPRHAQNTPPRSRYKVKAGEPGIVVTSQPYSPLVGGGLGYIRVTSNKTTYKWWDNDNASDPRNRLQVVVNGTKYPMAGGRPYNLGFTASTQVQTVNVSKGVTTTVELTYP